MWRQRDLDAVAAALAAANEPDGVLVAMGLVTALALIVAALPLRGGHGRHAGAESGALTVHQLSGKRNSHSRGRDERSVYPSPEPITWPPAPSLAERGLLEALAPRPPSDYVGRHRLIEPIEVEGYEPPLPIGIRVGRPPRPVAA